MTVDRSLVHLYIHVPFCARRCSYCDFAIAVRREVPSEAFAAAILREWAGWQSDPWWDESPRVVSIYFGGGTPSRLAPDALAAILDRIRQDREVAADAELTLEANPDDVTPARVDAWMAAGINRVSLGAQSFSAPALEWMHRTHNAEQIAQSARTLRGAGLANWSLDLIYALPADIPRDWSGDLDQALALEPTHLSLYGLTVEQGTPLWRWNARGASMPAPDDRAAAEFLLAHRKLAAAGFEHYEVSNAALPGYRARHNSAYWQRRTFIGLGPSAHSGGAAQRRWNLREWEDYRRHSEAGLEVRAGTETLTTEQVALEALYLGLRTREGVPASWIAPDDFQRWRAEGWAEQRAGQVALTPEGWLRLDALVARLTRC